MKGLEISDYVLSFSYSKGDVLTNKKLQKLLYYIEAWSLVHIGSQIDDNFEAWVHGPVAPDVYHNFKQYGYSPIQKDFGHNIGDVNIEIAKRLGIKDEIKDVIDEVILKYGALSSFELEMLSHSEEPWLKARNGIAPTEQSNVVIDKGLMQSFYSSLLHG